MNEFGELLCLGMKNPIDKSTQGLSFIWVMDSLKLGKSHPLPESEPPISTIKGLDQNLGSHTKFHGDLGGH